MNYYPVATARRRLKIDRQFLSGLKPRGRILELGAGSGRLAQHILVNSRISPENYVLFDKAYIPPGVPLKSAVHRLTSSGKMPRPIAGNYWLDALPEGEFDHIILNNSFFLPNGVQWTPERGNEQFEEQEAAAFLVLLPKLWAKLKRGGTIRISPIQIAHQMAAPGLRSVTKKPLLAEQQVTTPVIFSLLRRLAQEHWWRIKVEHATHISLVLKKRGNLPTQVFNHPAMEAIKRKVMNGE